MEKNAENRENLEMHQFLILTCLSHYPNGITFGALFKRMRKIFPEYFHKSSNFYYHISSLVERHFIHTELIKSIPPAKKLRITEDGSKIRMKTLQPLLLLESSPSSQSSAQNSKKKPISHREKPIEFSLDQAEQMELITDIQYQILNITSQEMEEISEGQAEKLKLSAKTILGNLCRSLGISME